MNVHWESEIQVIVDDSVPEGEMWLTYEQPPKREILARFTNVSFPQVGRPVSDESTSANSNRGRDASRPGAVPKRR